MVCVKCGKSITKNSNYCRYCGAEAVKAEKPNKVRLADKIKKKAVKAQEAEEKQENIQTAEPVKVEATNEPSAAMIFKEIEVTREEADKGAERIISIDGAAEPLHIFFPKLFCTGQLYMVKKYKFINEQGKKYKKNILIRVNIA